MRLASSILMIAITLTGCASNERNEPVDREGKLLTMAAAEAQQIPDATQRLTRQLQFASLQLNEGKLLESRQSLAFAAGTLREAKPDELKPQIRIAGWVSIAQFSLTAGDRDTAATACDQAVDVLKTIQPVFERPEYVVGLAIEVRAVHGKLAAAKVLELSGDWIKEIPNESIRRMALESICDFIFKCDDFDGGLATLRADSSPVWRSDTLAMLAARNKAPASSGHFSDSIQGMAAVPLPASDGKSFGDPSEMFVEKPPQSYGKPVDYDSVFRSNLQSQTESK